MADKYRLDTETLVGEGGFANVYRGTSRESGQVAAVKVLKAEYEEHPDIVASFFNDAESARILSHENIVRVLDVGPVDESPSYFAMEFCPGGDLRRLLHADPHRPMDAVLRNAVSLCRALDYCHSKGVLHGDLKASNILYRENGDPVLSDFGNAVREQAGNGGGRRIKAGSPPYVSPEMWEKGESNAASDLYSFGVLLYYAVSGTLPFAAGSTTEYKRMHLYLDPRPPSFQRPVVSDSLDRLILSLLEKDARDRPSSAGEVADILEKLRQAAAEESGTARRLTPVLYVGETESEGTTIDRFPYRIGTAATPDGARANECVLHVEDPFISRFHAFIDKRGEDFFYTDTSTNGSVVNGTHVHRRSTVLQKENVVLLGRRTQAMIRVERDNGSPTTAPDSAGAPVRPTDDVPSGRLPWTPTVVVGAITMLFIVAVRFSCL